MEKLRRDLERSEKKLREAQMIIDFQKKLVRDSRDLPGEGLGRRGRDNGSHEAVGLLSRTGLRHAMLLGVARASVYRFFRRNPSMPKEAMKPERALSDDERGNVLEILNSQRFVGHGPVRGLCHSA